MSDYVDPTLGKLWLQIKGLFQIRVEAVYGAMGFQPIPAYYDNPLPGISSNQIRRELGVSYQTAWFLTHRIRMAMTVDPLKSLLGQGGGIVEIDETRSSAAKSKITCTGTGPQRLAGRPLL